MTNLIKTYKNILFKSREFQIAIRIRHDDFLFKDKKLILDFVPIKNSILYWNADPFISRINNEYYVFVERCNRLTTKGFIAYAKIDSNFSVHRRLKWKKLIKNKTHLSFPNVYLDSDSSGFYVVPESMFGKSIDIYFFDNYFNFRQKKTILSNVFYVDSILFENFLISYKYEKNNKNYLDIYELNSEKKVMRLLHSVKDNNQLRPAGQPFTFNDRTIFVSQDCTKSYGGGLLFRYANFEKRDLECFFEINSEDLNAIFKTKKYAGIHTYNICDSVEIVDFAYLKFNIFAFIGKFVWFFKKRLSKRNV